MARNNSMGVFLNEQSVPVRSHAIHQKTAQCRHRHAETRQRARKKKAKKIYKNLRRKRMRHMCFNALTAYPLCACVGDVQARRFLSSRFKTSTHLPRENEK